MGWGPRLGVLSGRAFGLFKRWPCTIEPDLCRRLSPTGGMTVAHEDPTATLLQDGRVLVAGGYICCSGEAQATAEVYDPRAGPSPRPC